MFPVDLQGKISGISTEVFEGAGPAFRVQHMDRTGHLRSLLAGEQGKVQIGDAPPCAKLISEVRQDPAVPESHGVMKGKAGIIGTGDDGAGRPYPLGPKQLEQRPVEPGPHSGAPAVPANIDGRLHCPAEGAPLAKLVSISVAEDLFVRFRQQIGIKYTTAAKSGFITALYVIFVPIISLIIFRKKQPLRLWVSVALCLLGLYLLCARGGLKGFSAGDILTLACAVLFAGQILTVSFFVKKVGAVRLTFLQFAVCAIISTAVMVIFSGPSIGQIYKALPALIYVGVMSSAVGYSLQAIGQKGLNPAVASLAMCMESVFSLIGGIFILGQLPSVRETCGCILMFVAIVIAEVGFPLPRKERKNGSGKTD